jgi:hypothetical protein
MINCKQNDMWEGYSIKYWSLICRYYQEYFFMVKSYTHYIFLINKLINLEVFNKYIPNKMVDIFSK